MKLYSDIHSNKPLKSCTVDRTSTREGSMHYMLRSGPLSEDWQPYTKLSYAHKSLRFCMQNVQLSISAMEGHMRRRCLPSHPT